ncbi:MAG TPA: HEAT repeat domain-containing protein [Gemmatimonadaceae bacterium]|nr:HEAT repeat domain-containing protein [Gemmatimonadaceae bacterium]
MKYHLIIASIVAMGAAPAAVPAGNRAVDELRGQVPASWAPADSADVLWREGRRAVADEDWDRAAKIFQSIRDRFPKSAYVPDSYYWQAFSLYEKGSNSSLKQAVVLLDDQRARFARAETVRSGDSRQLRTRIRGMLAQAGDAASAADIATSVEDAARNAGASASSGASAAADRGSVAANRAAAGADRASVRRSRRGSSAETSPGCKSEDEDDRVEALNALLQMRSDEALPILKKVLARRDACSEVLRRKAVFLVSQKRTDEAADILIDAAKNDPDREVREQSVFWLGQVNTEKAVGLLEQILRTSSDEDMQDKALFALSQTRDSRGQQILRDYASREDAPGHLREQAIFWLGQRRSDDNMQFLKQLFTRTKNEDIQQKILFSASQNRGSGSDQWILDQAVNPKNSIAVRKQALFWGSQSGSVDAARLGALYDRSDDREFRNQVIFVLSQRSRSPEAVDRLIQIAKTEKDKELRKQAIFWLGHSRDPRALKALQELIEK